MVERAQAGRNVAHRAGAVTPATPVSATNRKRKPPQSDPQKSHLNEAAMAYQAGRLDDAERLCRQSIQARPDVAHAHNLLAVILQRKSHGEGAIAAMKIAISLNSGVAEFHSNLGDMQRQQSEYDDAILTLQQALALDPKSPQTHNNLGIVFFEKKQFADAARAFKFAIAQLPDFAEAYNNLGNVLSAMDQADDAFAAYRKAIDLKSNYAEAHNNLATLMRDENRFDEAEVAYRRAVSLDPNYLEGLNNLAGLLINQERCEDALNVLRKILDKNDRYVPAFLNTARAQLQLDNEQLAEAACKFALADEPENPEIMCVYGQVCHELDRHDEGIAYYERALEISPNYRDCKRLYAVALKTAGRLEDGKRVLMEIIDKWPNSFAAYSIIGDLVKYDRDNKIFQKMLAIIEDADDPNVPRYTSLHFALGKAYNDIGDRKKSFSHYLVGAKLKRDQITYDEAKKFKFFDDIKNTFSKSYFDARPFDGDPTILPIFVLGMPRSGSTLVEQIIASHPHVYGAGEIKTLGRSIGQLRLDHPGLRRYPAMIEGMISSQYAQIADSYLQSVSSYSDTAHRVTNKLLTNYYFAGFIHTLYPNAKIIHTRRDPVDTCLSCFTKVFKDGILHSYDLGELGRYYLKYQDLMDHWHQTLPDGTLIDIQYEEVVGDVEANARKIIDFCGLEWSDECLAFHKNVRPVKTASVAQVRQPIYTSSVERWRPYKKQLTPLLEALGRS